MCLHEGVLCSAPGSHALFEHLNICIVFCESESGWMNNVELRSNNICTLVTGQRYFYKMREPKMKLIVVRKVDNSDPESSKS